MSPRMLIPVRFILLMGQLIASGYILQTYVLFQWLRTCTPKPELRIRSPIQTYRRVRPDHWVRVHTVRVYSCRGQPIQQQNQLLKYRASHIDVIMGLATTILLVWFAFNEWPGKYILYIWGFLRWFGSNAASIQSSTSLRGRPIWVTCGADSTSSPPVDSLKFYM